MNLQWVKRCTEKFSKIPEEENDVIPNCRAHPWEYAKPYKLHIQEISADIKN